MSIKLISDVRLFESDVPNVDGNAEPNYIGKIYEYTSLRCLDVIERLLFLLRHRGFGFDGFDHLYLNFTPCVPHGEVRDVNRYNIREFSWYHYVDVGCDTKLFNSMASEEKTAFILKSAKKAALMKSPKELQKIFEDVFDEVLEKEERLLLPYMQKENEDYVVEVFTHISDKADFIPLIRVTVKNGELIAEKELRAYRRDEFICQFGSITIGKRSVRISPRKNSYADFYDLTPIKIEW